MKTRVKMRTNDIIRFIKKRISVSFTSLYFELRLVVLI